MPAGGATEPEDEPALEEDDPELEPDEEEPEPEDDPEPEEDDPEPEDDDPDDEDPEEDEPELPEEELPEPAAEDPEDEPEARVAAGCCVMDPQPVVRVSVTAITKVANARRAYSGRSVSGPRSIEFPQGERANQSRNPGTSWPVNRRNISCYGGNLSASYEGGNNTYGFRVSLSGVLT